MSANPLTAAEIEAALTQVNQQLTEFVTSANFEADLQTAFGASTDVELGATIIEALSQGEIPEMMVLAATSMNGADGAFDSVTGTVYLSDAIIDSEKLMDVITEEFGHYLDSQLNEIDSPGDEGELFMRLVNGEALSEADITGLRNQNDWGLIWLEGEPVTVQMSGAQPVPEYTSEPFTVNGDYIPVTGDFNGSGRTDILWYKPGLGADYIWSFNSDGTYESAPFTVNGVYEPIPGDFNGNGYTDILWYAPGTAPDYLWYFGSEISDQNIGVIPNDFRAPEPQPVTPPPPPGVFIRPPNSPAPGIPSVIPDSIIPEPPGPGGFIIPPNFPAPGIPSVIPDPVIPRLPSEPV